MFNTVSSEGKSWTVIQIIRCNNGKVCLIDHFMKEINKLCSNSTIQHRERMFKLDFHAGKSPTLVENALTYLY